MDTTTCNSCGTEVAIGDWPFCPHGAATARRRAELEPTVVYMGPKGEVGFVASSDPNCRSAKGYEKRGFVRKEMPFYEARKFASQMNKAERARAEKVLEAVYNSEQELRAQERSDLRAAMRHMSPRGRELAQYAIERGNQMDAEYYRAKDPGFHIEGVDG
jgi:hypothetical protein